MSGVRPLVRAARRARLLHRGCEAVLFGATATLVVVASAVVSGLELAGAGAAPWLVGLLAGAGTALAWWREHALGADDAARRLDARFGRGGALTTAFELEERGRDDAMARLLSARVLARVDAREARRALLPGLFAAVGAPVVGAATLALALEASRDAELVPVAPDHLAAASARLEAARGEALERVGDDLTDVEAQALIEAAGRAEELLEGLADGASEVEDTADALLEFERTLEALAADRPPGDSLLSALEEARLRVDAARHALGGGAAGGDAALSSADAGGTMSGRSAGDTEPSTGPGPAGGDVDAGTATPMSHPETAAAAARWWPARHDALVAAWRDARAPR